MKRESPPLDAPEARPVADLLEMCFRTQPEERISAAELLEELLAMCEGDADALAQPVEQVVEMPVEEIVPNFEVLPMDQRKYDFFITHAQATGQDQCGKLEAQMCARSAVVWYDMQAQDLTATGMELGVSRSRNLLLFLSKGYFSRPFCIKELRWAKYYNCNIVGVVEKDERHGPADFAIESQQAPADLKHIFGDVEFIELHRREPFQSAMLDSIMERGGMVSVKPQLSRSVSGIASLAELAAASGESVEELVKYTESDLDELAREKQLGVAQRNSVLKEAATAESVLKIRAHPAQRSPGPRPSPARVESPMVSAAIVAVVVDDPEDFKSVENPLHDGRCADARLGQVPISARAVTTFEAEARAVTTIEAEPVVAIEMKRRSVSKLTIALLIGAVVLVLTVTVLLLTSDASETPAAPAALAPASSGPCLAHTDTVGGSPCSSTVELHKSGTICFMPTGGYDAGVTCTWHVSCAGHIAPAFTVTELQTEAEFDTVTLYRGSSTGQQLTQLSGSLAQGTRDFEVDMDQELTIVFVSDGETSGVGFAGFYSCRDRCLHPSPINCGNGACTHGAGVDAGVCVCADGSSGEHCEITPDSCEYPVHVNCGSHGACSGGSCICADGFRGDQCDRRCTNDLHCSGHGSCNGAFCTCADGHTGENCETAPDLCANVNCGTHGSCAGGSCVCTAGFSGATCTTAPDLCEHPQHITCGSHGSCSSGVCFCTSGYTGQHCEVAPEQVSYLLVGTGYCRGPEGNCQHVNGRVHLEAGGAESGCAATCTDTGAACGGYAFHTTSYYCYIYGPGLDDGLPTADAPFTTQWEGSSFSNSQIGSTNSESGIVCKSKAAVAPSPPSPPCCGGGAVENLAEYSSPISWTTSGTGDNYELSCGGHGNEYMVFLALPAGRTIDIGMDHNEYDSRHETSWGGQCPGTNVVLCTDDPDTTRHTWTNDQGSTQNVFFVIDAFSSGSGTFQLSWSVSSGSSSSGTSMSMGGGSHSVQARILGSSTRGVLQMNIDGNGWGAVCDDGFNGDEARAFCAQLGHAGVGVSYDTTHGDSSFAADDINCPSGATSISSCSTSNQPYSHNCADSETVGLDCSSGGGSGFCEQPAMNGNPCSSSGTDLCKKPAR